ncbi:reticulon-like protein B2 isoform X1 [Elaeis guineensis]|uniref:Reticulon-like protein n=1 Tax=Elaeis guineensis var. tenera TaxID=51953 RepID=A0A6I9RHV4_ELAGV|nr:reticulon-like protein B2 [Elaeis guineensis]
MQRSSSKPGGQLLTTKAPSGGPKALYDFLGGGKVADVVLWRNKRLSAGILAGFTVIWLLFEVVEYHFVTLLCHMAIAAILVAFIWSNVAALFGLSPPKIPEVRILSQQAFKEFVETLHPKLSRLVSILHRVAFGEDLKLLLFAILYLWILSVMGSLCSFLNLLYFVSLCIQTLPALYKRYGREVDDLAAKGSHELNKLYAKLEQEVLKKIPRGPGKEKKNG